MNALIGEKIDEFLLFSNCRTDEARLAARRSDKLAQKAPGRRRCQAVRRESMASATNLASSPLDDAVTFLESPAGEH